MKYKEVWISNEIWTEQYNRKNKVISRLFFVLNIPETFLGDHHQSSWKIYQTPNEQAISKYAHTQKNYIYILLLLYIVCTVSLVGMMSDREHK